MSARFSSGLTGQAPLQLQLGDPNALATSTAWVSEVEAFGETETGSASQAAISYPGTPGQGPSVSVNNGIQDSAWKVIGGSGYTVAPSTPSLSVSATNLPIRKRLLLPRGSEILVLPDRSFLLFANATGGHTWEGRIVWEER